MTTAIFYDTRTLAVRKVVVVERDADLDNHLEYGLTMLIVPDDTPLPSEGTNAIDEIYALIRQHSGRQTPDHGEIIASYDR